MKKFDKQITTIIGKDAVCHGALSAPGSVRIDGMVEGDVTITGALVVGPSGKITGNVEAASAVIGGEINGNIVAPEKTELTPDAKVIGDIKTGVIVIDEKAVFQGKCDMSHGEEESSEETDETASEETEESKENDGEENKKEPED